MYCQEARDTVKLSCYYDIVIKVYFNRTLIIMVVIKEYILIKFCSYLDQILFLSTTLLDQILIVMQHWNFQLETIALLLMMP